MNTNLPINEENFKKKYFEAMEMAKSCKTVEEISSKDGPLAHMFKDMIQALLNQEMTDHLGYEHNDARSKKPKVEKSAAKVPISLRLDGSILAKLKDEAQKKGLPYQTFISSILFQYVNNEFIDKKLVDLIKDLEAS